MKKRVLLIADELRVGGGETYFYKIENNFKSDKIDLFTAACDGPCFDKINNKTRFTFLNKSPLKNIFKIINIVYKNNIDIIHANSLRLSMLSIPAKILSFGKVKIFYTKHNLTTLEEIHNKVFSTYINVFINKVLAVCEIDKEAMISKGVNKNKIEVVANSTDIDYLEFCPRYINKVDETLKIGILARLVDVKNHKFFLDIIEELQDNKDIKFKAFIGGDGDLFDDIRNEINERKLDIEMMGNVEAKEFLSDIDISMLVSKREVFPMSIIEALSVGSIVIATNVGGISDCIEDKKTGYLVNGYNVKDYVRIISNIYSDKESNCEIIKNGRRLVEERYSLKSMICTLEKIYRGNNI